MSTPLWRGAKCMSCRDERPSVIIAHWGYDKEGTLHVSGLCRWCLRNVTITHTFDEQRADVREAYNDWLERHSDQLSLDFIIWEDQMLEGRQLDEGDNDEG